MGKYLVHALLEIISVQHKASAWAARLEIEVEAAKLSPVTLATVLLVTNFMLYLHICVQIVHLSACCVHDR